MDAYSTPDLRINFNPNTYMMKVYAWMFLGMLLSAASAFFVLAVPGVLEFIFGGNRLVYYALIGFQLLLVIGLAGFSKNLPFPIVALLFAVYSLATGATLSIIVLIYTVSSMFSVFVVTAGIFAAMSAYGYFTKRDLTGIGMILYMLLIGIVLAGIVNIFLLKSSMLSFATAVIGVVVFTGLTAYDVQKIRKIGQDGAGKFDLNKLAVMGALSLYLDFINLFLSLLRIFGKRR